MTLQSLLISSDDSAAEVLGRVLSSFGIAMDRCSDPETTLARIQQQRFEALIVDFDDAALAAEVLEHSRKLGSNSVRDRKSTRLNSSHRSLSRMPSSA